MLAAFAWAGALLGAGHGLVIPAATGAALAVAGLRLRRRRPGGAHALLAGLVVFGAVATAAGVRAERVGHNPLSELARLRAEVSLTGVVSDDPRTIHGRFGDEV